MRFREGGRGGRTPKRGPEHPNQKPPLLARSGSPKKIEKSSTLFCIAEEIPRVYSVGSSPIFSLAIAVCSEALFSPHISRYTRGANTVVISMYRL